MIRKKTVGMYQGTALLSKCFFCDSNNIMLVEFNESPNTWYLCDKHLKEVLREYDSKSQSFKGSEHYKKVYGGG